MVYCHSDFITHFVAAGSKLLKCLTPARSSYLLALGGGLVFPWSMVNVLLLPNLELCIQISGKKKFKCQVRSSGVYY